MLKKLLLTGATAAVLSAGIVASPAQAAPARATCHAHQVRSHWECVTPGSYCPAAAHNHYGYAKPSIRHRLYRCSVYSNGRWRWKRA